MAVPVAVAPTSWPVCTAGAVRTRRIIMRGTGGSTVASWRRAAGGGRRWSCLRPAPGHRAQRNLIASAGMRAAPATLHLHAIRLAKFGGVHCTAVVGVFYVN